MSGVFSPPGLGVQMEMSGPWNASQNRLPSRKRAAGSSWLDGADGFRIGRDMPLDQWESQPRVTYAFRMRVSRYPNATADCPRFGPVWINKAAGSVFPMTQQTMMGNDRKMHALGLVYLNYFLAVETLRGEWSESHNLDPEWVLDNFSFAGIMHTDKHETTFSGGERNVVLDRQNVHVKMSNLFQGARGGDRLWWVVKFEKVSFSRAYEVVTGNVQHVTMQRPDMKPTKYPGYIVQVMPLVTRTPFVPRSDLTTRIEFDDGTYFNDVGYAVRIGRVAEDNHDEPNDPMMASRFATRLATQPPITVVLRV
jgi:hypothetical protein